MRKVARVNIMNGSPHPIVATVREGGLDEGVLLINSGTCIKRSFYDDIAIFFSERGYTTIQYDYVGVGDSRPDDLKSVDRSVYEWGALDMESVSQWIDARYPDIDKYILGHSMGGQLVGLMASVNSFKKIITVASSYGNLRNFRSPVRRLGMTIALWSLFPTLNKLYGYFPAHILGMGADWPYGVAEDWRRWNTRYLSLRQWMDRLGQKHYFDDVNVPMTSYVLVDDDMATEKVIPHFKIDYPDTTIHMIDPVDYDIQALGHFKSFKPVAEPFWHTILEALRSAYTN